MRTGGTTRYAAPETLEESPSFSGESDVYSYGMLAYHVASRMTPWQDTQHELRVMMAILDGKRPSLDALDPGCPPALRALIEQAWQQDRKARPTFEHVVEVAEGCIEDLLRAESGESEGMIVSNIREEYVAAKSTHARQLDQSRQAARARLEARRRKRQTSRGTLSSGEVVRPAQQVPGREPATGVQGSMTAYGDEGDSDASELSYESESEFV